MATISSVAPTNTQTGDPARNCALIGTGFLATASVTVGGVAATDVVVVNSTRITYTAPIRLTGAVVDVVLTNGDTSVVTKVNGFTYFATSVTHPHVIPIDITNTVDEEELGEAACGAGVSYVANSGAIAGGNDPRAFGVFENLLQAGPVFSGAATPGPIRSNVANYCTQGGWDSGFVLSTGDVIKLRDHQTAVELTSYEGYVSTDFGAVGDTGDNITFTFDFIPDNPILVIPLVFTSEEIPNFIILGFNDTISVKLDGVEIAYFPDRVTRIDIDTYLIHAADYYFTTGRLYGLLNGNVAMYLVAFVTPGQVYTLETRVTDITDGRLDSAGFIGQMRSYAAMYRSSVGAGGAQTFDDFILDLFPQIPEEDFDAILATLTEEGIEEGAVLEIPPAVTPSQWQLHRLDMKRRNEERA